MDGVVAAGVSPLGPARGEKSSALTVGCVVGSMYRTHTGCVTTMCAVHSSGLKYEPPHIRI